MLVGNDGKVFVQHLLGVDDGTYLQEIKVTDGSKRVTTYLSFITIKVAGKLNLHGATHLLRTVLLCQLQDFGQREDAMLQHTAERDDLAPAFIDAVADNLIHGVKGRGNALQRTVLVGLLDAQLEDVEAVVHLEVVAHMTHVQRIEACLGLAQCRFHLRGLQHLVRVIGRDAQRLTAVDDVFA